MLGCWQTPETQSWWCGIKSIVSLTSLSPKSKPSSAQLSPALIPQESNQRWGSKFLDSWLLLLFYKSYGSPHHPISISCFTIWDSYLQVKNSKFRLHGPVPIAWKFWRSSNFRAYISIPIHIIVIDEILYFVLCRVQTSRIFMVLSEFYWYNSTHTRLKAWWSSWNQINRHNLLPIGGLRSLTWVDILPSPSRSNSWKAFL